jgi:FixJ family two-component response regulator
MNPALASKETPRNPLATPAAGTVFIVDDDEAVRDALAMMLRAAGSSVETFASEQEFVEERADAQSGCIVLDVRMPGMSGIELQDWLVQHRCALPILFLTGHGDVPMAVRAVKRGAFDFLEKPIDDRQLLAAVDSAMAPGSAVPALPPAAAALTRREREVLDLILAGRQTRAIAEALFISVKTVEFHRTRIHAKLKVSSMAELFALCLARQNSPTGHA